MKVKKVPLRSCVVTKEKCPKQELFRIVRNTSGVAEVDLTGKKNGRGAYLKKDRDTILKAQKTKVLDRYLECPVLEDVYLELLEKLNEEVAR